MAHCDKNRLDIDSDYSTPSSENNYDVFDEIKGESESLGGLLLEINKNLPRSNEKIEVGKFLFSIESVDQKRIKRVRVFRKS